MSPYQNVSEKDWPKVTQALIDQHPLTLEIIHDAAVASWERLWNSTIGDHHTGVKYALIDPPAQVTGYLFEKIFAMELAYQLPGQWRGGVGSDKDLVCIADDTKSVEMKSSGQLGSKIFGNRSYGQKGGDPSTSKKDKSGYYITINFYRQKLTLIRFGWIDADDWVAQSSQTGQAAGLPEIVYSHKLVPVPGVYSGNAPVQFLKGVGPAKAEALESLGIFTINDLRTRDPQTLPRQFQSAWTAAADY